MTTYILIIGVVMMLAVVPSAQAVDYNDVATGNWGSASTWSPSGVRGSGDNITIAVTTRCLAPINRMVKLKPEEQKIVREYIELLRQHFPGEVSEIILFGSKARGESRGDSDIDILIVIDTENRQIKRKISSLCWDVMFNNEFKGFISPVIFFRREYEQYKKWNSSFLYNVSKEGINL